MVVKAMVIVGVVIVIMPTVTMTESHTWARSSLSWLYSCWLPNTQTGSGPCEWPTPPVWAHLTWCSTGVSPAASWACPACPWWHLIGQKTIFHSNCWFELVLCFAVYLVGKTTKYTMYLDLDIGHCRSTTAQASYAIDASKPETHSLMVSNLHHHSNTSIITT